MPVVWELDSKDYPVLDVECGGRLCIAIVERAHPHVLMSGEKRIVVLPVRFTLADLIHELIHAAGAEREEDALKLERFILSWLGVEAVASDNS